MLGIAIVTMFVVWYATFIYINIQDEKSSAKKLEELQNRLVELKKLEMQAEQVIKDNRRKCMDLTIERQKIENNIRRINMCKGL